MDALQVLGRQRRCLLAFSGESGPLLTPMAYWSDDAHLWMSTAASTLKAERLARDGACALHVPGVDGGPGVSAQGQARMFGVSDPVGLLLHGPAIAAALAALAASNASSIAGYVQDAARVPLRFAPQNRVVVRVRLEEVALVEPPAPRPGVAPALPTVIPPDVRRVLGGRRHVVVAVDRPRLEVLPAVLGAGFSLDVPVGRVLPAGASAVVVVDDDPQSRPTAVMGLALRGRLTDRGTLDVERATWWEGFDVAGADVPRRTAAASGIVLPD